MAVLAPFTACSPIASSCTGTCWDLTSNTPKSTLGTRDNFVSEYRLRIEKSFAFQKVDDGSWRRNSTTLQPVEVGLAATGPLWSDSNIRYPLRRTPLRMLESRTTSKFKILVEFRFEIRF